MKKFFSAILYLYLTVGLLFSGIDDKPYASAKSHLTSSYPDKLIINPEVSILAELGAHSKKMLIAVNRAGKLERLNSLLIARNNYLIVEKYFRGNTRNSPVNIKSVTKNVISALIGIAIEQGYLKGINQTIFSFYPEYLGNEKDIRKRKISIKHLLTMTSGLESTSFGNISKWVTSDNWVKYVTERKIMNEPGQKFDYSTGNTHLLSDILTKVTGMSSYQFAQRYMFDFLGIQIDRWEKDPQGIYYGGNNMFLTALDLMKFGILYFNKGRYGEKQIIPENWVEKSISFQMDPERLWSPFHLTGYGFSWWLFRLGPYRCYAAWGHGGQFIFIIHELRLVIVTTSRWQGASSTQYYRDLCELIEVYILAAVCSS